MQKEGREGGKREKRRQRKRESEREKEIGLERGDRVRPHSQAILPL